MTEADEPDAITLHAEGLFVARSALAETDRPARRLGVAELARFLSDPQRSLSMDEQRALFTDARLRADYRRLKSQFSVAELPALAAASVGNVDTRRFEGGTVSIHRSRVAGQVYVVVRFSWPSGSPRTMLLESPAGEVVKRTLPAADVDGEMMLVLDQQNVADGSFLRLLADPTATGSFLL